MTIQVPLSPIILVLCLAVSWEMTECPAKCLCPPFGKNVVVKCPGIDQIPHRFPQNTVMLYVFKIVKPLEKR